MLESNIYSTPSPTLNLPDSANECKSDIKTHLLLQPCHFNFLLHGFERFRWTVVLHHSYLTSAMPYYISYRANLLNLKTHTHSLILYMWRWCSKVSVFKSCSLLKHFLSYSNITCKEQWKLGLLNFNSGAVNNTVWKEIQVVRVLLPLAFISTVNCSDSYV